MDLTKVLLVDDHEVVRKGVRALLEGHPGYEVVGEAVDGREAIEKAAQLRPDVVILDVGMPDMNGLEATRQIIKENPQTRVLILTIHDAQYLASEALRAGARGYVLKSDAGAELLEALESLRQNKPFFTPKVAELVLDGFKESQKATKAEGEFSRLTSREAEIVQLLAEGKSSKEIATTLGITLKTVETHRSHIMSKLGVHSMAELVRYAIREKIVDP
ncbi:MAG: DNA-binding response regulator [Acidobacteria bacterium]|nr:MAG: DNA-binding response regulator [Acidobacteriota bacterium]